ncbi:MAG: hypothetical protein ABIE07_07005 [Candidatus Zixiibacteriota bacterium]
MPIAKNYRFNVFINCPFDPKYMKLFHAIVFTIIDCGFVPRCALEISDAGEERLSKILKIIAECKFGVHDISRTQLDNKNNLPRFNMPLELGLFLGARYFGTTLQKKKNCIILDKEKYRYQKFISDLGGKDVVAHSNKIANTIRAIRNWAAANSEEVIPGDQNILEKYCDFSCQLPQQCKQLRLESKSLIFVDYLRLAEEWLFKYDKIIGREE